MTERDKFPSEMAERFQIRLPPGLRDRIRAYAEREGRSMNTEIVIVLEREFPPPRPENLSFSQLLCLVKAFNEAVGPDALGLTAEQVLDVIWRVQIGDHDGLDPRVVEAIERAYNDFVVYPTNDIRSLP